MTPPLANIGVPMIFITLPAMMWLIFPVIVLEFLAGRDLKAPTPRQKWLGITIANLVSTFLGWPIAWGVLVVLQMIAGGGGAHGLDSPLGRLLAVTLQAAWLIPYEEHLYWMIPTAAMVLLVPFFFVSVYIERWVLRFLWKGEEPSTLKRFSWKAHLLSYSFLMAVVLGYGIYSVANAP